MKRKKYIIIDPEDKKIFAIIFCKNTRKEVRRKEVQRSEEKREENTGVQKKREGNKIYEMKVEKMFEKEEERKEKKRR